MTSHHEPSRDRHHQTPIDSEAEKRAGWRQHGILVIAEPDPRLTWPERELVRQLGTKLYGQRRRATDERPDQTDQGLRPGVEEVREADPDGRPVLHYRIIDPLARMRRAGTITDAMYNAARDFQAAFVIAQLEPLRAPSMLRVPGAGRAPELREHQLDARRWVHEALDALGGSRARRTVLGT